MVFADNLLDPAVQWLAKDDLICFSHVRWDVVYQRPQHLMSRCARERRVFFIEEPIIEAGEPDLNVEVHWVAHGDGSRVWVVVPHISPDLSDKERTQVMQTFLHGLLLDYDIRSYILWYDTPTALPFTRWLRPQVVVYDCMDELSLFKNADPQLSTLEMELFGIADLVFTGGHSLYKAKRTQHSNVYCFPSSIDQEHFAQARSVLPEPDDQQSIPHPRLGFFGVLDERLDARLLAGIAEARPDWHVVLIGPIVRPDLPKRANIHYLDMKTYEGLPAYLAGWDVALLPFALNESTRFINPVKLAEYLAAGKLVISTPIPDAIQFYSELGMVQIAESVDGFIAAIGEALENGSYTEKALQRDVFLAGMSWDATWYNMAFLIETVSPKLIVGENLLQHL
jgi:UDP-galactopyranose mutase